MHANLLILIMVVLLPMSVFAQGSEVDYSRYRVPLIGSFEITRFECAGHWPEGNPSIEVNLRWMDVNVEEGSDEGTPVYAMADGIVQVVREDITAPGGKMVQIENIDMGMRFLHLYRTFVYVGQNVTKGQLVGYLGNTGTNTTGSHLHLETWGANFDVLQVPGIEPITGGCTSGDIDGHMSGEPIYGIDWCPEYYNLQLPNVALFDSRDCKGNYIVLAVNQPFQGHYLANLGFDDRTRSIYVPPGKSVLLSPTLDTVTLNYCWNVDMWDTDKDHYFDTSGDVSPVRIGWDINYTGAYNMVSWVQVHNNSNCSGMGNNLNENGVPQKETSGYDEPPIGGSGSIGDNNVDIREYKNYTGSQYGSSDPNAGIINIPGGQNDRNESIQIDIGWSVMVYQEFDGQGGERCINQSIPNLEYSVFDNGLQIINGISSFRVYNDSTCGGQMPAGVAPGDTITVYAGFNWQGTKYGGSGTAVFNLPDYIEGATSSIGVYTGRSALVYELDNQQGGTQCFSGSDPDLRDNFYHNGHIIDDNIHSLRLFENSNCGGWNPPTPTPSATPIPPSINGINLDWTGGTSVHLAFVYENANSSATHTVVWSCDGVVETFTGAMGSVNMVHTCPSAGSVYAIITVFGNGNNTMFSSPNVEIATATTTNTPMVTNTTLPTAMPTNTVTAQQGVELLSRTLSVSANEGSDEDFVNPPSSDALVGKDFIRITYNLHGLCALGGDASAFVFNQSEWMYVSLSDYGQNCHDGVQTVDIPLSEFWNHSDTAPLVPENGIGGVRVRFWYDSPYSVEVFSAVAMTYESPSPTNIPALSETPVSSNTPEPTVTASAIPSATATPLPTDTLAPTNTLVPTHTPEPQVNEVELLPSPWVLDGGYGAEELYQNIDPFVLQGRDTLRVTYNLHGLDALGGDASALIFDQDGWQYTSLSDYGQNGLDGIQVVEIPLSQFGDLNPNEWVGTFHTRFWCDCEFTVEILSVVVFDSPNN